MLDTSIDIKSIYSVTDFLRNYKAHIAHLKETHAPGVLTVNGRAEVVVLDADSYQDLVERVRRADSITRLRAIVSRNKSDIGSVAPEELERRYKIMDELADENELLGLSQ